VSITNSPNPSQASWSNRLTRSDKTLKVHLIGIGGTGLSAIATVLLEMGLHVSGSDRQANIRTEKLAELGGHIFLEQVAANLTDMAADQRPDVVLISSAISPENPERQAASALGLPIVKRSEFLGHLLGQRRVIAVAGTHGKSTTTAMIVQMLHEAGIDAGYIVGTTLAGYGNAKAGRSLYFVIEADEYDHMFLGLRPAIAVITNVEWDHPDCYPTPSSFRRAFIQFVDQVPKDGQIISCADDIGAEEIRSFGSSRSRRWITYGLAPAANLWATNPKPLQDAGYGSALQWWSQNVGHLQMQVPGLHNLRNAMAAMCVARSCNLSLIKAAQSLGNFRGTARRFEHKGSERGVTVYDDYAHHPTEVTATLSAARQRHPGKRIWAVIQPHTFSRTRNVMAEMAYSFGGADQVIVTDIYASREVDDGSISAADLVAASSHPAIRHISGLDQAADYLAQHVRPKDVVLTLGAGDSYRIGEMLLERLRNGR